MVITENEKDNVLVDEFEKLQNLKKEIDDKLSKIKEAIIFLAKEKDTETLFGTNKLCSIKEYDKVVYPEDKTGIIQKIKEKGLYESFSSINYLKLGPAIIKGNIDNEILNLVKKEKASRLSLKKL